MYSTVTGLGLRIRVKDEDTDSVLGVTELLQKDNSYPSAHQFVISYCSSGYFVSISKHGNSLFFCVLPFLHYLKVI